MDATGLLPDEAWLEEHLRAAEAFAANGDDVSMRELIGLLLVGALCGRLHLCIKVEGDVAELLLHIAHNLTLGRCGEGVATLSEDFHQVFCEVPSRQVKAEDGMRQCVALIDWHCVRNTIP